MQKFYRLQNGATPSLGPFYRLTKLQQVANQAAPWGFRVPQSDNQFSHGPKSIFIDKLSNAVKFPGVMHPERPARGIVVCPAKATITNHSTLTFDDGKNGVVIFEFVTDGSPVTPPHELVDIQAATTPATVATALAAAIGVWTAANVDPSGDGGGFSADVSGARIGLVQAFPRKYASATHIQPARGTWYGKTTGDLGNNLIVASVPGEWTGLVGMRGGKRRLAGMWARLAGAGKAQVLDSFNAPILPP